MLTICKYSKEFLECSWRWLNDKEIRDLTMTPRFSKKEQQEFYLSLDDRKDYLIYGIKIKDKAVGACGLKNVTSKMAEYWGYIGEKEYWGKGYGVKIINEMINIALQKRLSFIYLKVINTNIRAIKLYLKMGFVIDEKLCKNNITYMRLDIKLTKQ